jgi:phosphoglycolate phosphatase-like HAD superfamily hydrolase
MIKLVNISNIIFDCDGVIFDSNQLKSLAFRLALEAHSIDESHIADFLAYHKTYGGVSRYVKLKYLITDIIKKPFSEELYNSLLSSYSNRSLHCYYEANYTDGCLDFLEKLKEKNIKAYVASGSDEEELNIVFKERGIDKFFEKIYGSPKTKLEIVMKYILPVTGVESTILIGDAPPDIETAYKSGIKGYGVKKYAENIEGLISSADKYGFLYAESLKDYVI